MFNPFIIKHKLTDAEFLVLQYYERRYSGMYLMVNMQTQLFTLVDEIKFRTNYKFKEFYGK